MLFLENDHSEQGYSQHSEPQFSYFNRCGRAEGFRVRTILEEWFSRYPEADKDEFRSRFQSNEDAQFNSSFFELYIHELLLRLGYFVTVHPVVSEDTFKRPDFLAVSPIGEEVIVEAVSVSGNYIEDDAIKARKNTVFDILNSIENKYFYLGIRDKGYPKTPPPSRKLCSKIERWLNSLNPDEYLKLREQNLNDDLPQFHYSHDGWEVEFIACPKTIEARKKASKYLIGYHAPECRRIDSRTPIRNAIKKKASRYGTLCKPYIIAVNILGFFADDIDITEALFGKEVFLVSADMDSEIEMKRTPDGVWTSYSEPIYTRVSAVLFGNLISPMSIAARNIRLYHNPWAEYRCAGPINQLIKYVPDENTIVRQNGLHPRDIFNLPDNWPF